ncbi:phage holin family protein [Variovorax ginsengisoli]|uniref:Membrane protein YqjE n=1 Tax=Variovorax ginsengisoli TaxID=363844 RepID=A0ABT9S9S4_9BURK|nr:phage holin family protein [Variovorax ginsengisoli]MDP9900122.1 putative membrane protein YqjE [Variovorax ginsengisoli]
MKLLSLFGLDARIRRVKIAIGEGGIAAEDRVQLLRMAWEEEKQRLKLMLVLVIAVLGLATVAVALLSVAVVVHYWETPYRITAAWTVAGVWIALWAACALALFQLLRRPSRAFDPLREQLGQDWAWAQDQFHLGKQGDDEGDAAPDEGAPRAARPVTRDELLARIATQRQRIAVLQTPAPRGPAEDIPADEPLSAAAWRTARTHPVASGVAAAAVVAVLGPRRLLRWAAFAAPLLWRMR